MIWLILIVYVFGFVRTFKFSIKQRVKEGILYVNDIYLVSFLWFIILPIVGIFALKNMMDEYIKKLILTEQNRIKKKESTNKNQPN
jgi:hypothetical protein